MSISSPDESFYAMSETPSIPRLIELGNETPPVCRLGLATRGNTRLTASDVHMAVERGVNYLNWCTHRDGMSQAISELTLQQRSKVVVALQFYGRTARAAEEELARHLSTLKTDFLDVITFYYVESSPEWEEIVGPGGALEYLQAAKTEGLVRLIGLTTHQRALGAQWARTGLLDLLMIRYNAAHRGAEKDIFPITRPLGVPVVVYTCMRWGAVLKTTPEDPPGFKSPSAPEWYRFALCHPDVAVALMAPDGRHELVENLSILDGWRAPHPSSMEVLRAHGRRVRRCAGSFP